MINKHSLRIHSENSIRSIWPIYRGTRTQYTHINMCFTQCCSAPNDRMRYVCVDLHAQKVILYSVFYSRAVKYYILRSRGSTRYPIFLLSFFLSLSSSLQDQIVSRVDPKSRCTFSIDPQCFSDTKMYKIHTHTHKYAHAHAQAPAHALISIIYRWTDSARWPWSRSRVLAIFKTPMSRVKCFGHVTRVCGIRQTRSWAAAPPPPRGAQHCYIIRVVHYTTTMHTYIYIYKYYIHRHHSSGHAVVPSPRAIRASV